jgi:acyl-CoA synthetase (AMP-forming)/AMP-acid ligase II
MLVTATGAKVIFMHKWSKKEGLRLLREEKVTLSGGVPFIVQEILESASDEDISTLENLTYGGRCLSTHKCARQID